MGFVSECVCVFGYSVCIGPTFLFNTKKHTKSNLALQMEHFPLLLDYLTCPSGKESIESVSKGEAKLGR